MFTIKDGFKFGIGLILSEIVMMGVAKMIIAAGDKSKKTEENE